MFFNYFKAVDGEGVNLVIRKSLLKFFLVFGLSS